MREPQIIGVKHNIEVAHRLWLSPGKCENIHGHSMWVTTRMTGHVNDAGMVAGIEYGAFKKQFRGHLDSIYDHHLLLNADDDWAQVDLPGLQIVAGDPTTENIAQWINNWVVSEVIVGAGAVLDVTTEVWETSVNFASAREVLHARL